MEDRGTVAPAVAVAAAFVQTDCPPRSFDPEVGQQQMVRDEHTEEGALVAAAFWRRGSRPNYGQAVDLAVRAGMASAPPVCSQPSPLRMV